MEEYRSILGPHGDFGKPCIAFYKEDGSNLRFEYSRKRGWYKFGTRTRLFDHTDPEFGSAVHIFQETLGDGIAKVIRDSKDWRNFQNCTVFCEFFGPKSFAGLHDLEPDNDPKTLRLFDVSFPKKGVVDPRSFVKHFSHLPIPQVVYEGNFNQQLIDDVKNGRYNLVEGVVCKGGRDDSLWMRKIKTIAYLDKLKAVFKDGWEKYGE